MPTACSRPASGSSTGRSSTRSSSSGAPAGRSWRSCWDPRCCGSARTSTPRGSPGACRSVLLWITAFMYLAGLVVFAWTALRYVSREYVLTNRRVLEVEGVLNRRATDSSLEKINDAVLEQSLFGRLFGYGDLRILTAAEAGIEDFRMIRGPVIVQEGDAGRQARVRAGYGARRVGACPADPDAARGRKRPGIGTGCRVSAVRRRAWRTRRPSHARSARMRSPGRSTIWPTCATAARSVRLSTTRRRRTCCRDCEGRSVAAEHSTGSHGPRPSARLRYAGPAARGIRESRPVDLVPTVHPHRDLPARRFPGPRVRPRLRGLPTG